MRCKASMHLGRVTRAPLRRQQFAYNAILPTVIPYFSGDGSSLT